MELTNITRYFGSNFLQILFSWTHRNRPAKAASDPPAK